MRIANAVIAATGLFAVGLVATTAFAGHGCGATVQADPSCGCQPRVVVHMAQPQVVSAPATCCAPACGKWHSLFHHCKSCCAAPAPVMAAPMAVPLLMLPVMQQPVMPAMAAYPLATPVAYQAPSCAAPLAAPLAAPSCGARSQAEQLRAMADALDRRTPEGDSARGERSFDPGQPSPPGDDVLRRLISVEGRIGKLEREFEQLMSVEEKASQRLTDHEQRLQRIEKSLAN